MVKISVSQSVAVLVFISVLSVSWAKLKEGECEVCIKVLTTFKEQLPKEADGDMEKIESNFMKFCKDRRGKEERFCYYLGGLKTSATSIVNAMAKPMSYHKPVEKICEELKKKDMQMCELKYDKQIDLAKVDLKKLKVKDLKKILDDWDESNACKGCAEKADFIRVIKELMPKYAPEAHKQREEL